MEKKGAGKYNKTLREKCMQSKRVGGSSEVSLFNVTSVGVFIPQLNSF